MTTQPVKTSITIVWLLLLSVTANAADVSNLRVWTSPERTRAVLDLSGPVEYKVFTLDSPHRLVIDIENVSAAAIPSVEDGVLKGVRTGRRNDDDLRVVLDLEQSVRPKSFLLKPAAQYGHRLVLDLHPENGKPASQPIKRAQERDNELREVVVAIDPGHGGEDPGAIGAKGSYEKDVVFRFSKELKARIDAAPGMRAILTRESDYYVDHYKRMQIAREHRADLFVSVHADGFKSHKVHGSSVYVLSRRGASSEAARWLAARENAADLVGGVSLEDKDETLAAVLLDLSQSATAESSSIVAQSVLDKLKLVGKVHKKNVEHAAFLVLKSPDIPSILVETAFITNEQDERRLLNPGSRGQIADAVFQGVQDYFYEQPIPGTWIAANLDHQPRLHVVARGETLSGIASKHNVKLTDLRLVNNIQGDRLLVGTQLTIPTGS